MSIKKKIKLELAQLLGRIGLNKFLLSWLSCRRTPIFTFHRVFNSNNISDDNITCPFIQQTMFKLFLCHALSKFKFIPLNELVGGIRTGKIPKRCAAVTFDDGWKDNFDYAFPVLKELKIPATIFLVSSWIGTHKAPWSMNFNYLVKKIEENGNISGLIDLLKNNGLKINRSKWSDRRKIVYGLNDQLKKWPLDRIHYFLDQITNRFEIEAKSFNLNRKFLTWEEVLKMKNNQIEFGSHSQNHAILTNESGGRAFEEIKKSKEEIEVKTGIKIVSFSYPNGNYNPDIISQVRELGYECACTTEQGWVSLRSNLFTLKRIDIHQNLFEGISNRAPAEYLDFILYDSHFRK
jgi:peptidoglycan/xylan/chitin deacetylase (PgdA/CDA1 family)